MLKKKNSTLKVEKPTLKTPSKLVVADEISKGKRSGRKPMKPEEKGTEFIGIKITKKQKQAIIDKAGLVPVATYLKAKLKESGVI
jgi:hypothetical protein